MASTFALRIFAAPAAAPPSMMAMRLPTGLLDGNALSESTCSTRILSGWICRTSPTTVETSVSCACPEVEVAISAVTAPDRSMRTRQESIHVVVSFFGLNSGSKEELPPDGSRQVDTPMPASSP
ncbi:hypothetical protein D3C86_1750900 [compost metagenome]